MADTKEKLVSAAISLLEEGSEEEAGFTMRAIAQRAGVGLGCANYHFGSKERLLAACGNRLAERAMARWEQAVAQNPAAGPLRLWGECVFGMLHQAPMAFQTDTAGGASQTGLWDILFPPEVQALSGTATPVLLWAAMRGALLDRSMLKDRLGYDCSQPEGCKAFLDLVFSGLPGEEHPGCQDHTRRL